MAKFDVFVGRKQELALLDKREKKPQTLHMIAVQAKRMRLITVIHLNTSSSVTTSISSLLCFPSCYGRFAEARQDCKVLFRCGILVKVEQKACAPRTF